MTSEEALIQVRVLTEKISQMSQAIEMLRNHLLLVDTKGDPWGIATTKLQLKTSKVNLAIQVEELRLLTAAIINK